MSGPVAVYLAGALGFVTFAAVVALLLGVGGGGVWYVRASLAVLLAVFIAGWLIAANWPVTA